MICDLITSWKDTWNGFQIGSRESRDSVLAEQQDLESESAILYDPYSFVGFKNLP